MVRSNNAVINVSLPKPHKLNFENKILNAFKSVGALSICIYMILLAGCSQDQVKTEHPVTHEFIDESYFTKYALVLYGTKAEKTESVKELPGKVFHMEGAGNFIWKVNIPKAGDYEVELSYASDKDGSRIQIIGEKDSLIDVVHKTEGYYFDSNIKWQQNFERIKVKGTLALSEGEQTISFVLADSIPRTVIYFRCIELNLVSERKAIDTEIAKAIEARASADWLANAGYGLMFHWTSQSQPENGSHKTFGEAVRDFDVDAFADMVEHTGAGYVLFTNGHAESYCPAPIKAWERIHPGMTTERDLLMELSTKLNDHGIKFMIYMNSPLMAKMGSVTGEEYMENHRKILTEIGQRYGDKIAGYCFDSWYQGYEEYPDFSFEELFKICKTGYPNRLVSFNTWILPVNTPWQDFWFGETYIPGHPAAGQIIHRGPGRGLQYNSLIVLENLWVHDRPMHMKPPWLNADDLAKYIKACMEKKGTVTINIGIYQEGTIGTKSLELMKEVRKQVRGN